MNLLEFPVLCYFSNFVLVVLWVHIALRIVAGSN